MLDRAKALTVLGCHSPLMCKHNAPPAILIPMSDYGQPCRANKIRFALDKIALTPDAKVVLRFTFASRKRIKYSM